MLHLGPALASLFPLALGRLAISLLNSGTPRISPQQLEEPHAGGGGWGWWEAGCQDWAAAPAEDLPWAALLLAAGLPTEEDCPGPQVHEVEAHRLLHGRECVQLSSSSVAPSVAWE